MRTAVPDGYKSEKKTEIELGLKLSGSFYEERLRMRNEATTPELKAHFQAELDVVKAMNATYDIRDTSPSGGGIIDPPAAKNYLHQPAAKPQSSSPAPAAATAPDSSFSGQDNDSNKKVQTLMPMFEKLSKETGVPANMLAAVMVQESRGYSIDSMKNAGGLMQLGRSEFKYLQDKHPDQLGGMSHLSTEGQVTAAALYLKELKGSGSWDDAMFKYNHGPNAGNNPQLGDPNYMNTIHDLIGKIERGESLPS